MEGLVYDLVAGLDRGLTERHQTHTEVLDKVAGRKGKITHLLGVDLLRLRYYREVSVVNCRVKKRKQTESKSCGDLGILVLGINEVDLVVSTDVLKRRELGCKIDRRIDESLVALGGNALDDYHILVSLKKSGIKRCYVLTLDGKRELDRAVFDSGGTNKRNGALDRLGEEKSLAARVENETGRHLEAESRESLGEAGDEVNDLGVLNALGKSERSVVLIYDEIVIKRGKSNCIVGCACIGRGGDHDALGAIALLVAENYILAEGYCALGVLLLTDEEVDRREREILGHLTTECGECRCTCNESGENDDHLAVLLKVSACGLGKEECLVDLDLGYAACRRRLVGALLAKTCGRIADDEVVLVLDRIEEGNGVVISRLGDIVLVIYGSVELNTVIVAALFSDSLKVVLKHRNKVVAYLVAGEEYLLASLCSAAYLLYNCGGEDTRACTGIKNSIYRLSRIKFKHFCHESGGVLLGEESAETDVFTLGLCSYELRSISNG